MVEGTSLAASLPAPLTPEEQDRVDRLLSAARSFHYAAIVLAGLSLALSSLERAEPIELPLGGVDLPATQAAVALYLLVIALAMATDRLARMAAPWCQYDPRRPPFAWVASGPGGFNTARLTFWLLVPLVVCAIATANTVKGDATGFWLSFVGLMAFAMPRNVSEYWELIQRGADQRGGKATFSIFLLYWYRIFRGIITTVLLIIPVLAIVPKWREGMAALFTGLLLYAIGPMFLIRSISTLKWIYRRIDSVGARLGFPTVSEHYK